MSAKHTAWSIVFALVILSALWFMPAQAQDAPPVAGATSDTLYLPVITRTFPLWFTDEELTQAQSDAGYDIDTAQMHTVCYQDATSTPDDLRWSSCEQYFIHGIGATEGTQHYIWWLRMGNGIVTGVEVGN